MAIRGVTYNDAGAVGAKTPQLFRDELDARYGGDFNVKAYGAIGDGNADDSAAIQAAIDAAQVGGWDGGGTVYFPPGKYKLGSTLLVKEANVTLAGASTGSVKLVIANAASTYPAITFTGYVNGVAATPGTVATYPWNFQVRDMWIEKTTPAANSAPAISLYCVQVARLHNVQIRGFGVGVLCSAAYNVYAHQVHIQSNSAATVSVLYGWKFDSNYACFSSYLSHCTVSFGGENIASVTSYGYFHNGNHPSDWFLDHCEAVSCTYGYYYSGNTASAFADVFDVHFVECVADQCQCGFGLENNLTPGATGGQIDIDGCYWANRFTSIDPTPQSTGISINNCSGITIRGFQGWSGNPADPTHYQNNYGVFVTGNSRDISITGCNLKGNFIHGIYVNTAQFLTIFGNTLLQTMSISGYGIVLKTASKISIAGNTIRSLTGLATPMVGGIHLDGASTGVAIGNNVVDTATVTTPLTVLAGGSASAKNNIGISDT